MAEFKVNPAVKTGGRRLGGPPKETGPTKVTPSVKLRLHPKQFEVYRDDHRFKVVVAGRRWGKTKLAAAWLIAGASKRRSVNWYIAPSYQMAKQIIWQDLKNSVNRSQVKRIYDSDLRIVFKNGAVIQCKGADNPDSLRGVALDRVCMDEFQDIQPEAWQEAIRPTLTSTGGIALIIGTPKSFNHLYQLYAKGQSDNINDNEWASWQFPTITSPFIPRAEIESAKRDMDTKSFKQEFLASFEGMSGKVYHAFDRHKHVGDYKFNPDLPIWIGQDFNVDPMTSCVMQPQRGSRDFPL